MVFSSYGDFMNAVLGLMDALGILQMVKFGVLAIVTIGIAMLIWKALS